jgi:hypothetical protein
MDGHSCREFARETFGSLKVRDRRNVDRVVQMTAGLAMRPAGTITEVFEDSAEREGAYRLLSRAAVRSERLTEAMCDATLLACVGLPKVYIPVDGSSLSLTDRKRKRGLGGVGTWKDCGQGIHVMTAMALDEQGVPIGVCAQKWWARTQRSPKKRSSRRKVPEKETRFALETVQEALERFRMACPETRAIAVMDRGFDAWPILELAESGELAFIARAQYNRRLASPKGAPKYLRDTLEAQPVLGRYRVEVPARSGNPARTAHMEVRATRVELELRVSKKRRKYVALNAVLAEEVGGPTKGALSWMLLTTEPIDTFEQVLGIVNAYTLRWRIEEMHRVWKRGSCNVEDTQLRSFEAIVKWATLHCAVATRALRLTQLARTRPETPAIEEFTQTEVDAAIALRKKRTKHKLGDELSLHDAVQLVAEIGGYTGKSSGGPPGPTVVARGLERVAIATEVLQNLREK